MVFWAHRYEHIQYPYSATSIRNIIEYHVLCGQDCMYTPYFLKFQMFLALMPLMVNLVWFSNQGNSASLPSDLLIQVVRHFHSHGKRVSDCLPLSVFSSSIQNLGWRGLGFCQTNPTGPFWLLFQFNPFLQNNVEIVLLLNSFLFLSVHVTLL